MLGIMFHQARSPPPLTGEGLGGGESPPTKGGEDFLLVILAIKGAIFS